MKFVPPGILAALLAGSTSLAVAQEYEPRGPVGPGGGPPGGGGSPDGRHHPPPPIIEALDLNHDHVVSADEIARAAQSLKALDKNGDGQLTPEELRPPMHHGGF